MAYGAYPLYILLTTTLKYNPLNPLNPLLPVNKGSAKWITKKSNPLDPLGNPLGTPCHLLTPASLLPCATETGELLTKVIHLAVYTYTILQGVRATG